MSLLEITYAICQNGENSEVVRGCHWQYPQYQVTDLESEVKKAGFYKKNHYSLRLALSSAQPESLLDESTVTPSVSFHSQLLDPVTVHSDVPQLVCNDHRRDAVGCSGECKACGEYIVSR